MSRASSESTPAKVKRGMTRVGKSADLWKGRAEAVDINVTRIIPTARAVLLDTENRVLLIRRTVSTPWRRFPTSGKRYAFDLDDRANP